MFATECPLEQRFSEIATAIQRRTPGSEIRQFGSTALRSPSLDSAINLLITAPDEWTRHQHRFHVRRDLWQDLSQANVSLNRMLYSQANATNIATGSPMSSDVRVR
jgi:predicted nucleotidyltransferase